jgi:acyl-CoA thioesterase-1
MWRKLATLSLALVIPIVVACGSQVSDDTADSARQVLPARVVAPRSAPAPTVPDPAAKAPRVVFLGDSLTAGLGLDEAQAYPAVVERELRQEGVAVQVVNAGVSGDTSAGGLSRLPWLLGQRPDVVVVALGANDGLRALPVEETEKNLREIVRRSQAAGARVLLVGMRIPPNYGPDYAGRFEAMYPRIAADLNVPLVPFLLEGVGGEQSLNQADGLHPTAGGQEVLARNVLTYLADVLRERDNGTVEVAGAR